MENLLAMPVHPLEVMLGKIMPYIMVGYIQVAVILTAAHFLFHVPIAGSLPLLLACVLVFLAANLTVGMMFSTIAKNQLQAMQMTFFFFLPSMLLSGFMFPFRGMPDWAQVIGARPAAHPLPAHRARHHAEGQRLGGNLAECLAAAGVHGRGAADRLEALSAHAGLVGVSFLTQSRPSSTPKGTVND